MIVRSRIALLALRLLMATGLWSLLALPAAPRSLPAGASASMSLWRTTALHGHHFQVIGINGRPVSGAVRDTVHVPPMTSVTIAFDADHPGKWAFRCRHFFHMAAGTMAMLTYDGIA